jgi:hypothetical protein
MANSAVEQSDSPVAATNEGQLYSIVCKLDDSPQKSRVTTEMLEAFRSRREQEAKQRDEEAIRRNDRAFRELREREKDEEFDDLPVRLVRPQFFKD